MWVMWFAPFAPFTPGPVVVPRSASRPLRVLSVARHPSFRPEQAGDLLEGLSRRELRELWAETSLLLESPVPKAHRFAYSVIREELLQALERADQRGFERWYARTCSVSARRR